MIGQPPRLNKEGYDLHEQDRWFQDIYRHLQTLTGSSSGESTTTNVTNEYGSSTTNITVNSKRYLRWMNC